MEQNETVEEYKKKKELKTLSFLITFTNVASFVILMISLFMVLFADEIMDVLKAIFFVIISGISSISSILYAIRKDIKSSR
ncbi:MAG: hypothetical protein PHI48_10555 [Bacteroidales bacterium]|nr:hypothetical protein [Bacteroidales bacterium]MDD4822981.1 hypothetical protein [Bacteroidales bacterium]